MEKEKDHHSHDHHHHSHVPDSKPRLLAVIIFNVIITVSEFAGGLISGSLALLSDAWHNFSDVLSLMLGYAGEKVSEKEGNEQYTFGLKRFEVLIALINSTALFAVGVYIVYEAVNRYLNPQPVDISIMLPVAGIGLLGNAFSILVLASKKDDSLNMKAAFLHLLYDAISSFAVIIAGIVMYFTELLWIDLIMSLLIVVMIAKSSLEIIVESLRIFMQRSPTHIDTGDVFSAIIGINGVESVHGLHIWSVSSSEIFLSCHVRSEENVNSDSLIQRVNDVLRDKYCIEHTTIQIERDLECGRGDKSCCR